MILRGQRALFTGGSRLVKDRSAFSRLKAPRAAWWLCPRRIHDRWLRAHADTRRIPIIPEGAEELSLRGANDENIGRSSDLAWLRANQGLFPVSVAYPHRERCS